MAGLKHEYVTPLEMAARIEGFCLGIEFGKAVGGLEAKLEQSIVTMAEVDAYYNGLLREIKEMQDILAERKGYKGQDE